MGLEAIKFKCQAHPPVLTLFSFLYPVSHLIYRSLRISFPDFYLFLSPFLSFSLHLTMYKSCLRNAQPIYLSIVLFIVLNKNGSPSGYKGDFVFHLINHGFFAWLWIHFYWPASHRWVSASRPALFHKLPSKDHTRNPRWSKNRFMAWTRCA